MSLVFIVEEYGVVQGSDTTMLMEQLQLVPKRITTKFNETADVWDEHFSTAAILIISKPEITNGYAAFPMRVSGAFLKSLLRLQSILPAVLNRNAL